MLLAIVFIGGIIGGVVLTMLVIGISAAHNDNGHLPH